MAATVNRHPDRIEAIDRIKALAIIAVAVNHAGPSRWSPLWTTTDQLVRATWTLFHVPAFLVVAGMLYRTEHPMTSGTVRRRVVRIVVPYAVVLTALYATGIAPLPAPSRLPFAMLTGESYGIYYFVPMLLVCILFGWVLSRLTTGAIVVVTATLLAYAMLYAAFGPTPGIAPSFWTIRDPLATFYLGYFACGWLGIPALLASRVRRVSLVAATAAALTIWIVLGIPLPTPIRVVPLRQVYTLAVTALLWGASFRLPFTRFLSDATLGLYLLHRPIMEMLPSAIDAWPPLARITVTAVAGLGGAALACAAARAALGRERSRFWLGA